MRLSTLLGRTLRDAPADAETAGHQLVLRAAIVRQTAAGVFSFLPLGWRVIRKIEQIIREEMDAIAGQELHLPVLHPAELWRESGRWYAVGPELWRLRDRWERDFVLGMTHEEVITDLARREVRSYRQLPFMAYQIQTKVRDEARPRGGLVRLREFIMKDAYSFHADQADLDAFYPSIYQAYLNIFRRCGLEVVPVEADPGMIGGSGSHEFIVISEAGDETIVTCAGCGYAANVETAEFARGAPEAGPPAARPEKVHTPGIKSIIGLGTFLDRPTSRLLKAVFYEAAGSLVAIAIRGDLEVNEAKLARALGTTDIRMASDEMLREVGIPAGFASPVGMPGVHTIVDESVPGHAWVAGANEVDHHLLDVWYGRDFKADAVVDIATAASGHRCARCGDDLQARRGLELGHTFKLGTKYSQALGATYLGADGREHVIPMGCYGIGLDRLLGAIVQHCHDERGIVWPASVAPVSVHLVGLGLDNEDVRRDAEALEADLRAAGIDVLFDDRAESPGVKFADADLIGLPLRVTVSPRTRKNDAVELKARAAAEAQQVPRAEAVTAIVRALSSA